MLPSTILLVLSAPALSIPLTIKEEAGEGCNKESPELDICIRDSLNAAILSLAQGWESPEVPGIDPLRLASVEIGYHERKDMDVELRLSNVEIQGLKHTLVHTIKSGNLEGGGKLEVVSKTPQITALGSYLSEGAIATFPLHSQGTFNVTMNDVTTVAMVHLEREGTFLKIADLLLLVMPTQIHIQAGSLLDGDNTLGQSLNVYLNENSFELYNLVKPRLMSFFGNFLRDLANSILLHIPDHKLIPNLIL